MRAGGLKDAVELGWCGERVARGEGADRAGLLVRKREALAGPAWGENGPPDLGWEEGKWASGLGCPRSLGWFLVSVFLSIPPFLILILFLTQTNLFEFNNLMHTSI